MKSTFTFLCAIIICVSWHSLFAQSNIEQLQYIKKGSIKNVMATKDGFAMSTFIHGKKKLKHMVKYTFFNEEFEVDNTVNVEEYRVINETKSVYSENYLHSVNNIGGRFFINSISTTGDDVISVKGVSIASFKLNGLMVFGDELFFLVKDFSGSLSRLVAVNWKTGKQRDLELEKSGMKSKIFKPMSMCQLGDGGCVIFAINKNKEKGYDTQMFRFNAAGEQTGVTTFKNRASKLHRISELTEGRLLVSGTVAESHFAKSNGVFMAICANGKVVTDNNINFSEIPGFVDYSPKEYKKGYKTAQLQMTPTEDGFLMWGESFYINKYKMNGTSYFENYHYTHGFSAIFNLEGELEKLNSFETNYLGYHVSSTTGMLKQVKISDHSYLISNSSKSVEVEINLEEETTETVDSDDFDLTDKYMEVFGSSYSVVHRIEGWDLGYIEDESEGAKLVFFKIPHSN